MNAIATKYPVDGIQANSGIQCSKLYPKNVIEKKEGWMLSADIDDLIAAEIASDESGE